MRTTERIEGISCVLVEMRSMYLPLHTSYLQDPDVYRYLRLKPPISLQGQIAWLREMQDSPTDIIFAVLARKSRGRGVFIGVMGLHEVDWRSGSARTGTILGAKRWWGKGIGTEAKLLQLKFAFEALGLRVIRSGVAEPNLASRKFLEKAGYFEVGRRPGSRVVEGCPCDEILFLTMRENWERAWEFHRKTRDEKQ